LNNKNIDTNNNKNKFLNMFSKLKNNDNVVNKITANINLIMNSKKFSASNINNLYKNFSSNNVNNIYKKYSTLTSSNFYKKFSKLNNMDIHKNISRLHNMNIQKNISDLHNIYTPKNISDLHNTYIHKNTSKLRNKNIIKNISDLNNMDIHKSLSRLNDKDIYKNNTYKKIPFSNSLGFNKNYIVNNNKGGLFPQKNINYLPKNKNMDYCDISFEKIINARDIFSKKTSPDTYSKNIDSQNNYIYTLSEYYNPKKNTLNGASQAIKKLKTSTIKNYTNLSPSKLSINRISNKDKYNYLTKRANYSYSQKKINSISDFFKLPSGKEKSGISNHTKKIYEKIHNKVYDKVYNNMYDNRYENAYNNMYKEKPGSNININGIKNKSSSGNINISPNINIDIKPQDTISDFNKLWSEIGERLNSELNSSAKGIHFI